MLYAARSITHARVALHALRTYPSLASQHVRRHACGDKSRIGSSAEPAWRMLGAQQLSSSISAARRLLSLPATRAHPAHSAQADWAGSTHLHTFHAHGHRPCRSFSYGEPWFYPAQSRPRSTFRARNVDGLMTLHELHRTMHLRHAADGRPCPEVGQMSALTLIVWNCQILLT